MKKYKPYSIITPPFDPVSGGIRVMWGLYGWLLAKGQIAYINAQYDTSHFIAIYPEIYHGNEAGADTVVRYILQTPGVMSSYGVPSPTTEQFKTDPQYKNDKFFVFSQIYNTLEVKSNHILFLPILNLHVFKRKNKHQKRNKTCFLVGKGINQMKHPKDSIELTRSFAIDQQALADILNECHTFYCYDRLSAMMEIARLCGCGVKYYGTFSKEELAQYEPGMNGIQYKDEREVDLEPTEFAEHYQHLIKEFDRKLDNFIDMTQS